MKAQHNKQYELSELLFQVIKEGDIDLLLNKGENIDAADENGLTILHYAALAGQPELIKSALGKGANIDVFDKSFHTPLTMLVLANSLLSIEGAEVFEHYINIKFEYPDQIVYIRKMHNTLGSMDLAKDQVAAAKELINNGANIKLTALHILLLPLALMWDESVGVMFIDKGAPFGENSGQVAELFNQSELLKSLAEKGIVCVETLNSKDQNSNAGEVPKYTYNERFTAEELSYYCDPIGQESCIIC